MEGEFNNFNINNFIVFIRNQEGVDSIINENDLLKNNLDHFYFLTPCILPTSASSYRSGESVDVVDARIHEYATKKQLY